MTFLPCRLLSGRFFLCVVFLLVVLGYASLVVFFLLHTSSPVRCTVSLFSSLGTICAWHGLVPFMFNEAEGTGDSLASGVSGRRLSFQAVVPLINDGEKSGLLETFSPPSGEQSRSTGAAHGE